MKEQGKNPLDQTNEEEIGSLPETEFRIMIVKMIQNLVNNTINEIKNSLEGINSSITEAEERLSDLEDDKIVEVTTTELKKKKE